MTISLHDIFNTLIPTNISSIPLVNTLKRIFIATLEQNSKVSKRITEIFNVDARVSDTPQITKAKQNLKYALYTTYIHTLFKYIQALSTDKSLRADLEKYNYTDAAIYRDIYTIINSEFIQSHHAFTQRVGTKTAIRYMYQFSKYLETGKLVDDLEIDEITPFVMHYQASLGRRIYNEFLKPQVHPLGWTDFYETVFSLILHDYFGIEIVDDYSEIELSCGADCIVFINDENTEEIKKRFLSRINPVTMQLYTLEEIGRHVSVIPKKIISTFRKYRDDEGKIITVFVFEDQTVLWHNETEPRESIYTTYADYLAGFIKPLERWGACWKLNYRQQTNFKFLYYDYAEFLKMHFVTMIKEDNGGQADLSCYNSVDPRYMFRVTGHEIVRFPGIDESKNKIENSGDIADNFYKKFTAKFNYNINTVSDIVLSDRFGNEIRWNYVPAGSGTLYVNTHSLYGNEYTIWIDDYVYKKYQIWATGLNNFKRKVQILDCYLYYGICRFKGIILDDNFETSANKLKYEMLQNKAFLTGDYYLEFIWEVDGLKEYRYLDITKTDKYTFEFTFETNVYQREYSLTVNHCRKNGLIIKTEYYRGSNINLFDSVRPRTQVLNYENKNIEIPTKIDITPIKDMSEIPYWDDYPPDAPARIGERVNGTFYPPLKTKKEMIEQGESWVGMYEDGNIIHTMPYDKSFWENLKEETVFIFLGFAQECIDTSDFIITDNPAHVSDGDFEIIGTREGGFYLYTTVSPELNNDPGSYLFSKDRYYLFATSATTDIENIIITLVLNGGSGITQVEIPEKSFFSDAKGKFGYPTKNGYEFSHWSLVPDGDAVPDSFQFTTEITLYANYNVADITITADSGKGEF